MNWATDTKVALFSPIQWEGARRATTEKLFFFLKKKSLMHGLFREVINSSNFRHVEVRLQVYPESKERYLQT